MATYYSQGSDDWSTVANWDTTEGGGGSNPSNVADMDDDTFIIQAAHTITLDCDMSGFANGIAGLQITGGATPGMLVCESGGDGTYYLKIKTGTDITGTTDTNRGRILANSDEVWGNTGALPNGRKFIIDLQGTAQIEATNLDIALYCTNPANTFVHCYGTKFDFAADTDCDPATNVLTLNDTAPAEGTDVTLVAAAGATLPTGLYEDRLYYVRDNDGNDCKLATTNSDDTIVDITADGSGTIYLLTEQASSTAELNVLEDVTSDSPWSATDGHDFVVLVDALAPASYDIQRTTISVIDDADTITLAASVNSAQYAGTRLYLSSRNISIRYYGTTNQGIVNYASDDTHGGVFQCEIRNAQSQTSFYGYGINYGLGHTISGSVSGCNYGIYYGSGHTISGSVSGCSNDFYFPVGDIVVLPGSASTYTLGNRGALTGENGRISIEEYLGTPNAHKILDQYGDIIKTACDGTGDAPSADPDSGNGYCIEASNIQDIFGVAGKLVLFQRTKHRMWLTADTYTVTYKIQTTYAGIAEGGLTLRGWYIGTDGAITETTDNSAISQRSGDTDWTQTLAVTFTTSAAGWASFQLELTEYESGNEVYVWPTPAIT